MILAMRPTLSIWWDKVTIRVLRSKRNIPRYKAIEMSKILNSLLPLIMEDNYSYTSNYRFRGLYSCILFHHQAVTPFSSDISVSRAVIMTTTHPIKVEPGRYKIKNKGGLFLNDTDVAGNLLGVRYIIYLFRTSIFSGTENSFFNRPAPTNTDQEWEISYLGNGEFRIISYGKGLFVTAAKGSSDSKP